MALTLTGNISASARSLGVTGTVPDSIGQGYRFRLDDELLELAGFGRVNVQYPVYRQDDPDRNAWFVRRAVDGIAASHTAGATILGATDAYVASGSETTAPEPFASGGGGASFPESWTGPVADGSVTIATDDPAVVPLTVVGATDHAASVFTVQAQADSYPPAIDVVADEAGAIYTVGLAAGYSIDLTANDSARVIAPSVFINAATLLLMKVPLSEPGYSMGQFGQVIMWLDNTAGSAKLKFKTLNSDEVEVHGEVALAP